MTVWRDPDPAIIADAARAWLALPADEREALPFSDYAADLIIVEWTAFPDVRAAFQTIEDFLKYRCRIAMALLADSRGEPN